MNKLVVFKKTIEKKIMVIRGHNVMLDKDLALLYGVDTKVLIQAVKRNVYRFPEDFMFQLSKEEFDTLRSQIVTSNWGGRRYLPYVFTEQGVAMLSSVLHSRKAIEANIAIMRAFVKTRQIVSLNKDLSYKVTQLELKLEKHDEAIHAIFEAIRQLMVLPDRPKRRIGFHSR